MAYLDTEEAERCKCQQSMRAESGRVTAVGVGLASITFFQLISNFTAYFIVTRSRISVLKIEYHVSINVTSNFIDNKAKGKSEVNFVIMLNILRLFRNTTIAVCKHKFLLLGLLKRSINAVTIDIDRGTSLRWDRTHYPATYAFERAIDRRKAPNTAILTLAFS